MTKYLVKIVPKNSDEQALLMTPDQYDSLLKSLKTNEIKFSTMSSEFHWMKKGEEWSIPLYVVFLENYPSEYLKEFENGKTVVFEDS